MKERPKLMNTEMVKAVLDGRKTQTRIPIPSRFYGVEDTDKHDHSYFYVPDKYGDYHHITDFAGFPQVGDLLYVREKWLDSVNGGIELGYCMYAADMPIHWDAKDTEHGDDVDLVESDFKWKPSIHMEKRYARLWLKVNRVWVERVQDITDVEALSEGVSSIDTDLVRPGYSEQVAMAWEEGKKPPIGPRPIDRFEYLWNSIYGKTHDKWDNNRHVVACEFERTEKPISTKE